MAIETFDINDTLDDGEVYGQFTNQEGGNSNGRIIDGVYKSDHQISSPDHSYLITTDGIGSIFNRQVEFIPVYGRIYHQCGIYLGASAPTGVFNGDSVDTSLINIYFVRTPNYSTRVTRTNNVGVMEYWNFTTHEWQADLFDWNGIVNNITYRLTFTRDGTNTILVIYDVTNSTLMETITAPNATTKAITNNAYLYFGTPESMSPSYASTCSWDNAGFEEAITKIFEESGNGVETVLTDKILSILDVGEGIDILKADKPITFIDSGEGTDIFTAIKEVIEKLFTDSGIGVDALKTDKALIITDAGVGVDILKTDKVVIMADVGVGVDALKTMKLLLYTDTGLGVESLTAGIIMSIKDTFSLQPEDLISLTNIHTVMDAPSRVIYGRLVVKYSEDLTVEYTKDDIIQFSLLEEEEYSSVPTSVDDISRISANELTFSLYNINKQFNIYNADSPLYGKIKKNIQVIAHLGAKVGDDIEWHQLGIFYVQTWDIPESGVTATFNAWDRLETLRNSTYLGGEVQVNATLYELAEAILQDAGLTADQYQLDIKLQEVTIPYAWFDRGSHRDALKKIATLVNGKLYCNRQGKLIFEVR